MLGNILSYLILFYLIVRRLVLVTQDHAYTMPTASSVTKIVYLLPRSLAQIGRSLARSLARSLCWGHHGGCLF